MEDFRTLIKMHNSNEQSPELQNQDIFASSTNFYFLMVRKPINYYIFLQNYSLRKF